MRSAVTSGRFGVTPRPWNRRAGLILRTFRDEAGQRWDVVPGRESWGGVVALFVPEGHPQTVRQTVLHVSSPSEATTELSGLSEDGLRALLQESEPKTP